MEKGDVCMDKDQLELQRLQAEISKLEAETEAQRRSRTDRVRELIRVLATLIAAGFAGYAAFETYRVTQVETKLANFEKQQAIREKVDVERELDNAVQRSARAKQDLAALQAAVGAAQQELASARREATTPEQAERLDAASRNLQSARTAAPTSSQRVQISSVDTIGSRQRSEGLAVELISHGYVGSHVKLPAGYDAPETCEVVFQRPEDRRVAEQLRWLLRTRGISSKVRMSQFDNAFRDAIEIRMPRYPD